MHMPMQGIAACEEAEAQAGVGACMADVMVSVVRAMSHLLHNNSPPINPPQQQQQQQQQPQHDSGMSPFEVSLSLPDSEGGHKNECRGESSSWDGGIVDAAAPLLARWSRLRLPFALRLLGPTSFQTLVLATDTMALRTREGGGEGSEDASNGVRPDCRAGAGLGAGESRPSELLGTLIMRSISRHLITVPLLQSTLINTYQSLLSKSLSPTTQDVMLEVTAKVYHLYHVEWQSVWDPRLYHPLQLSQVLPLVLVQVPLAPAASALTPVRKRREDLVQMCKDAIGHINLLSGQDVIVYDEHVQ